jgi:RimJ/RimL family protein N-acetyltransferase
MNICGEKVKLIPACEPDRKKIFEWLTRSDLTPSIMGPPVFKDHPIPSWEEFCKEYPPSFFNPSGDGHGRNFIIVARGKQVGTIGYDLLDRKKDRVVLDIWMRTEKYCGHGYGSDALQTLTAYINKTYGITSFIISPSGRNKRAIAAYTKAGFKYLKTMDRAEQKKEFGSSEYDDNIIMIRKIQFTESNNIE